MNTAYKTETRSRGKSLSTTQTGLDTVSRAAIGVMGGISALIGLWAAACLVSALIGGGGLLNLTSSWFQAVTGM
jgi:hypothetical protein